MTADPIAPGRGLPAYQPATEVLAGTCSVPSGLRPRSTTAARTPMAGTVSQTGSGVRWTVASQRGVTVRPDGTGTGDGPAANRAAGAGERLATTSPAVPAATASSPAPSIKAASTRACGPRPVGPLAASRRPRAGGWRSCPGSLPNRLVRCHPARRRRWLLTPDDHRDTHKLTVVARTWPHDGSAAVPGDVFGTGTSPARSATSGLTAPRGNMSEPASGLPGRIPGLASPAAGAAASPGSPVAGAGSAAPADLTVSRIGPHQSTSHTGSHQSASHHAIACAGSVGAASPV